MRRLKSAACVAAMALAGAGGAVAAPAQAATQAEYVALGDSYASGVGAGSYDPASGDCKRSTQNYPHQWAAANPDYSLTDVSCSGATIQDVRDNQLSALSSSTNFVTVTVGGNDAQFSTLAQGCLTQTDDNWCQVATLYMSAYAKGQLSDQLASLYADIKARAPHALVLVLGYPEVLSTSSTECPVIDVNATRRTAMNNFADALAEGTAAAATKASVYFLDMRKQFEGHGACGPDSWINDLNNAPEVFHPNLTGYTKGYSDKLKATWG
ncbi:SGNH/GDSL hydrolase family protein [Streptomyces sp. NPDC047072]|uniref:SGNH/GDSL hydrolase family protein n=1 Tax=Streptomyces sp. NPDC047072 TaxID=3154809 RepID=UPI0033D408B7